MTSYNAMSTALCKNGHDLISNRFMDSNGRYRCRLCTREAVARHKLRSEGVSIPKRQPGVTTTEKTTEYYLDKCVKIEECLIWTGAASGFGYPVANIDGKGSFTYLHKWVYEQINGKIQDGNVVDHICNIPRCLNPNHLREVTHRQNVSRTKWQGNIERPTI